MKNKTNKLIPDLRFPEFNNKPTWAKRKLSEVLFEHKLKSEGNEEVFSVSVHKGVINQIEHLGRRFAAASTNNYKRVMPGDIIYTKSPTGDFPFGIIKQSKISEPVIVSPLYGVFKPETVWLGKILDSYFEYPERTINYLVSIIQKGAKNTININNEVFLSRSLVLPYDKEEQQKIASCLSSLDELITAHNQKLEALKAHKKGLMQNLFPQEGETVPKYRFPEFEHDGDWEEKRLEDLIDLLSGYAFKSQYFSVKGQKLITPRNFSKDGYAIFTSDNTKYTIEISDEKYLCSEGDLLLLLTDLTSTCELLGKPVFLKKEDGKVLLNQRIVKVIPKDKISSNFLLQFFLTDIYHIRIKSTATGSTVRHSSSKIILDTYILLPTRIEEQQKIASCLSSLDTLITIHTEKIEQLKLHKKGLMQGLFPKINN